METARTSHLVIWAEHERIAGTKRPGYTTEVVTLCGKKKNHLRAGRLLYPGPGNFPTKPACKLCQEVLNSANALVNDGALV